MKDPLASCKVVEALAACAPTTNTAQVGAIIDRAGYGGVLFLIHASTLTTGAATFTPLVEHGDQANLSDAVAVTTKELGLVRTLAGATFDGTKDNTCYVVGYAGGKRYCRLTITPASNAAAASLDAQALLVEAAAASVGSLV
jgi:hypothetical protein